MSDTKQDTAARPLGSGVQRGVRPQAPTRAVRLTLKLDADDMQELAWALHSIADRAERGEMTTGCAGGPSSGHIYELLQDPTMTHDAYHAALRAYLDGLKATEREMA